MRSASCAAAIADDGQTEPVAVRVAGAVGGEPPERLEEPVNLVGRYRQAGVAACQHGVVVPGFGANLDAAAA